MKYIVFTLLISSALVSPSFAGKSPIGISPELFERMQKTARTPDYRGYKLTNDGRIIDTSVRKKRTTPSSWSVENPDVAVIIDHNGETLRIIPKEK